MAPTPPFSLAGRTALVTGSSTGLGKAVAACLGHAGAKVALNYANNQARGEAALAELRESGIEADLFRADVSDEAGVDQLFTAIEGSLGPVDIVVVNATPDQPHATIENYDWDFYQQMLDFFVKSPYLLARRALPSMKSRQHGRLINITSEVFHLGVHPFSAYVAAKGGQTGWSRSMAGELAPFGITVNMIAPAGSPWSAMRRIRRPTKTPTSPASRWAAGEPQPTSAGPRLISPATRLPSLPARRSPSTAARPAGSRWPLVADGRW